MELFIAQQILIDLAKHLMENADMMEASIMNLYYECLTLIIKRKEFELQSIGFSESYIVYQKNNKKPIKDLKLIENSDKLLL